MKRRQVTRDRYGDVIKVVEFHEPALTLEMVLFIVWRTLVITHAAVLFFGVLIGKYVFTGRL